MKPAEILKVMTVAAAMAAQPACSSQENCDLNTTDNQAEIITDAVKSESDCVNALTDACKRKTNAVCAVSPMSSDGTTEKQTVDCADPGETIATMCADNDVLVCNATNHPEASTLICDGEER